MPPHIAISGAGLAGLTLALALRHRNIACTVFEAKDSLAQPGAGINLGPNSLEALRCIDAELGEEVLKLCTRNPPGMEDVWMSLRLPDGTLVGDLHAKGTGNSTVGRAELLGLLAHRVGAERVRFGMRIIGWHQERESGVRVRFANGDEMTAACMIACDGVHSQVRESMLGEDNSAARPQFSESGAYRAVLPAEEVKEAIGNELARTSNLFLGPSGYVIMYPIDMGRRVNIGLWTRKLGPWSRVNWWAHSQRTEMQADFQNWGGTVLRIMDHIDDPPFSAVFHHASQPKSVVDGSVCLAGDAAHAMPPHQGAGAGQAMEDAFVLAEVLCRVHRNSPDQWRIRSALKAYETVRMPRAQQVLDTSVQAMNFWSDFYHDDLKAEDSHRFTEGAKARFTSLWYDDVAGQARRACNLMDGLLNGTRI